MKVSDDRMKELYFIMKKCRAFEERVSVEYRKGNIAGPVHTSVGQEAISAGTCCMMEKEDYLMTTHRGHGDIVAKGGDVARLMAELFGRRDGYGKGKLGSMHLVAPECNVLGCSAIVASSIPQAAGVAMACKKLKNKRVTVCFLGDGSTFEGAFHEGMTMASAYQLPVIYICQNNKYAISTCSEDYLKIDKISQRSKAYGIPGVTIDGNDIKLVAETVSKAIKDVRTGKGPVFIDMVSYRHLGHGLYEDGKTYRNDDEVEKWKKNDPIVQCFDYLKEKGLITDDEDRDQDRQIKEELDAAVDFALNSPEPDVEELYTDVYVQQM